MTQNKTVQPSGGRQQRDGRWLEKKRRLCEEGTFCPLYTCKTKIKKIK
jgi:hypothetical protein